MVGRTRGASSSNLADVETNIRKGKSAKEISPIAVEAVKRIDALFELERTVSGAVRKGAA